MASVQMGGSKGTARRRARPRQEAADSERAETQSRPTPKADENQSRRPAEEALIWATVGPGPVLPEGGTRATGSPLGSLITGIFAILEMRILAKREENHSVPFFSNIFCTMGLKCKGCGQIEEPPGFRDGWANDFASKASNQTAALIRF